MLLLLESLDDREVHECDMEKDAGFHEFLRIEDAFLFKWVSACNHGCKKSQTGQLGMLLCKIVSSSIYVIITMCGLELVGKPLSTKQWMHEDGRLLG